MGRRKGSGRLLAHFAAHVMEPTEGCRPWTEGAVNSGGYGIITVDYKSYGVHALACEAWHGPKPFPEAQAAHRCGNPACWAGEHLYWATASENNLDKRLHGRSRCGESNPKAKLSAGIVAEIRERFASGETQTSLAREFGVSTRCVCSVVNRQTWVHV